MGVRYFTSSDMDVRRVLAVAAKEIPDTAALLDTLQRLGDIAETIQDGFHSDVSQERMITAIISLPDAPIEQGA